MTIEQLKQYRQIEVELARIYFEWAKQNLDNRWQHYAGWVLGNENICINYSYNDIVNNVEYETEYGTKLVSWE